VSALQHSRKIVSSATFPPRNAQQRPRHISRVRSDAVMMPARDPGPLRDASWGDPGLVGPRSRYLNPSARDRGVRRNSRRPQRGEGRGEMR